MASDLLILAGRSAYNHIRENGLAPSDIAAVLGASGAAKWLVLYGLDSAIFSQWFKGRDKPLTLFGTSIGAWKLVAAAQDDPARAFDRLKDAYIAQSYKGRPSASTVSEESVRVMGVLLDSGGMDQNLAHPYCRISFSAVRCKGLMGREDRLSLVAGMARAFGLNLVSRNLQRLAFERTVFHHPREAKPVLDFSGLPAHSVSLTPENFSQAMLATGSIPVIMNGVRNIPGAPAGIYRDGGLLDYHPAFPLAPDTEGFILYPHFFPHVIRGWFDKKMTGRWAGAELLDKTIILAPSPEFVSRLPFGRIPDRKDFVRFQDKDHVRMPAWKEAAEMSKKLGRDFLDLTETGKIKDAVRLIE
ncbi:MAG: patatin-like phospholipase family protein [Desulfatibacillum sp.]|nr:patatin-like phospholipase family protein [Desulfatibacillum sp.]